MHVARLGAVLLVMFLLVGCSSLPDVRDERSQASLDGQLHLKRSRQLSLQNRLELAFREAALAYEKFTLSDDVEGRVLAGLDLARLNRKLGKPEDSKAWAEKSRRSITAFVPSLMPDWQLLKAEFFFAEARYDSVLHYTEVRSVTEAQDETIAHLLAYRLMAGLQIPSRDDADLKRDAETLEKITSRLENKLDDYTLTDPFVLGFAEYSLGYAAMKRQAWERAGQWFEKALAIDRQFGNYRATADDLYGLGVANERLRQTAQARGYFERAKDICYSIGDTLSAQRSAFRIMVIKFQGQVDQDAVIKELQSLYSEVRDENLKAEIVRFMNAREPVSKE